MLLENAREEYEVMEEVVAVEESHTEEEVVELPKKKRRSTKKKEEVAEPTEDAFAGMIEDWKAQHKRIFKNEIDGETIIWRRLKRGEYKEILAHQDPDEDSKILSKQEMMVKAAVLYPFDVEALIEDNAGVATVLSEEILARSGFAISYTEEL